MLEIALVAILIPPNWGELEFYSSFSSLHLLSEVGAEAFYRTYFSAVNSIVGIAGSLRY